MQANDWILKRNCSITPRQLWQAYAAICTGSGLVALAFAIHGAWYVLAYAVLELGGVGLAFLAFGRHAADRERIALAAGELVVEVVEADRIKRFNLDARRATVETPVRGALVTIRDAGTTVEVGRFVPEQQRRQFARELSLALRKDGPATDASKNSL
ncbi:MAG: hypothetical protein JWP36_425 [Paucimonas sp.]|nr:hypothetical protein [Paucimonas sp.]